MEQSFRRGRDTEALWLATLRLKRADDLRNRLFLAKRRIRATKVH